MERFPYHRFERVCSSAAAQRYAVLSKLAKLQALEFQTRLGELSAASLKYGSFTSLEAVTAIQQLGFVLSWTKSLKVVHLEFGMRDLKGNHPRLAEIQPWKSFSLAAGGCARQIVFHTILGFGAWRGC